MIEGKVWCKLSTTLRCSGEKALSFLLDVNSRSLVNERDVVVDDVGDGNKKEIVKEEGHSRTVRIVEEMTGAGGVRFNNKIVRKLVWEMRRENLASTTRQTTRKITRQITRNSSEAEIGVFGSPTTEDIENGGVKRGVSKLHRIVSSLSFGLRRRSLGQTTATKTDNSIVAVKVIEVSEVGSTIEVLVDTPKKYKKRKVKREFKPSIEWLASTNTNVLEKEKKETERMLPTLYDYRTLSAMQRCFQRWRPLNSLDERDGDAFGKMLMENTSKLFDVKERSEKSRKEKLEWFVGERASRSNNRRGNPTAYSNCTLCDRQTSRRVATHICVEA